MATKRFKVSVALIIAAAVILVTACGKEQESIRNGGDPSPTATAAETGTPTATATANSSETASEELTSIYRSAADFAVEFKKRQMFAPVEIGETQTTPEGGSSILLSLGDNGNLGVMTAAVNPDGSMRDLTYKQSYPFYTEEEIKQMESESDPGDRGAEIFSTLSALIEILSPNAGQEDIIQAQKVVPDYLSHPRANLHKEETREAEIGPIVYRATIGEDGMLTLQVGSAVNESR